VSRFLGRTWRLVVNEEDGSLQKRVTDADASTEPALNKLLHKTIKKVSEDTDALRFNTAISQMMTFVNEATSTATLPRSILLSLCEVISPYASHIAEELWARLGGEGLVCQRGWPAHDEALCTDDTLTLGVQVNGKRRDEISVPAAADDETVKAIALASATVQKFMEGKPAKKVIVIKGRLVNIVV
jgi:leucyl-tRNA synthetase